MGHGRRGPAPIVLGLAAAAAFLLAGCGHAAGPPDRQERRAGPGTVPPPATAARRGALRIRMTGGAYRWHIRYPGPDGALDTEDDLLTTRNLHLPAQTDVTVDLRSDDYTYLLYVPALGVMESALAGMPYDLALPTDVPGTYDIRGGQMCGTLHPDLLGDLVVQEPEEFQGWLRGLGDSAGGEAAPGA